MLARPLAPARCLVLASAFTVVSVGLVLGALALAFRGTDGGVFLGTLGTILMPLGVLVLLVAGFPRPRREWVHRALLVVRGLTGLLVVAGPLSAAVARAMGEPLVASVWLRAPGALVTSVAFALALAASGARVPLRLAVLAAAAALAHVVLFRAELASPLAWATFLAAIAFMVAAFAGVVAATLPRAERDARDGGHAVTAES